MIGYQSRKVVTQRKSRMQPTIQSAPDRHKICKAMRSKLCRNRPSATVPCPARSQVFSDLLRVLRPGGRFLFSDALIIGGLVSHEEIAIRSSIGIYFFSPPGENERLLKQSRFRGIETRDTTDSATLLSKRWHDAREKKKAALVAIEGEENFAGVQRFLTYVHTLTAEKRLLRFPYTAMK